MRNSLSYSFLFFLFLLLVACGKSGADGVATDQKVDASTDGNAGGTLEVAFNSEPDSLDWMSTGASPTRDVAWHIFEGLFALDKDYEVQPMLAEGYEVSEDQLQYDITIREDVAFHDGSTVTLDDVLASFDRWLITSSVGAITGKYIDEIKVVDERTFTVRLNEVYNSFLSDLAAPKSAFMVIPKEVAESAGEQLLTDEQLIGTGPYAFKSWKRGSGIVLEKFANYSAREEENLGGLAGKKVALLDEINIQYVNDAQVIINGLKTNLYDYGQGIPADLYDVIEADPSIDPVTYINGYTVATPDKSEAPFDEFEVREALKLVLDNEAIAKAAYGNEEFYHLDGALFDTEQTELYTAKGTDKFLDHDIEKAEKLLANSSYDGKPITIMYSNDNETYKRISQVMQQQMEEIGFVVELAPYEWATYLEKWQDPANWDIVVVGWSTRFSPNELGMLVQDTSSSGWYQSDRWSSLLDDWGVAKDSAERTAVLGEMNETIQDEIPFVKIANETTLNIKSTAIPNYDNWVGPRFWNVTKE